MSELVRFFKDEGGVTAIEYSLITALIALVIIIAATTVGAALSAFFQFVADTINAVL